VNCRDVLTGDTTRLPSGVSPEVLPDLESECQQLELRLDRQLAQFYAALTLPGSISTALNLGVSVGLILLPILVASHVGSEYAWNTVRTNLLRGIGRWQFSASRLILLVLMSGGALLIVTGATVVSSVIARHLVAPPAEVHMASTWSHALGLLARSWVALIPYVALAGLLTLLTRSSSAGMAITIGYHLGEQVVVATLSGPLGWFHLVARYLLAQNIAAWVGLTSFGQGQTVLSRPHALSVLAVYTVVCVGTAFYLFQVRDMTGASDR
jgi:ABC-type transport system involved in multi-copper enzyme maturation permease subunit